MLPMDIPAKRRRHPLGHEQRSLTGSIFSRCPGSRTSDLWGSETAPASLTRPLRARLLSRAMVAPLATWPPKTPLILFVGGLPVTAGHGAGVLKTPMPTAYAVQGHAEPHEPNERHPARKPAPGVLEGRPGQRAVLASASEAFPPPCVVRRKAVTLRACGPA